jgi:hypothetical protein
MNDTQIIILKELGITDASPEKQADILVKMAEVIQNRVAVRLTDILTDQELQRLDELSDKDPAEMFAWLQQNVPTYNLLVQEETIRLRNELSRGSVDIKQAISEYIDSKAQAQST